MTKETEEMVLSDDVTLVQYGDRDQVRELGSRIKRFLPNGNKMESVDALSLAQLSIAHGLNPFIGDVWWIPKKGIMVGINGLRKSARRVSPYSVDIQLMRTNEREEHDVPDGAAAYIARLFRADIMGQMVAARQPVYPFIGIGISAKEEWKPHTQKPLPHTKSLAWVARKRAEADALKAAYDIDFATDPTVEHHGITINGALVGNGAQQLVDQREHSEAEMQEISNGLYGAPDAAGLGDEWPADIVDASGEGAPEVELPEQEPVAEAKVDNGKDTDDQPEPAELPEHLAWLAEIEPNQDREDMEWTDFWQSVVQELGFNHGRHASNALKKALDSYPPDGLSKTHRWAILARHQEQADEEE